MITVIIVTVIQHIIFILGVLAGIWPCGIIAMVAELFGSESLSQVYGHLHTYMNKHAEHLSNLSE